MMHARTAGNTNHAEKTQLQLTPHVFVVISVTMADHEWINPVKNSDLFTATSSGLLAEVNLSPKSLQASSLRLYGPFLFQFTLNSLFSSGLVNLLADYFFSVCTYRLLLLSELPLSLHHVSLSSFILPLIFQRLSLFPLFMAHATGAVISHCASSNVDLLNTNTHLHPCALLKMHFRRLALCKM